MNCNIITSNNQPFNDPEDGIPNVDPPCNSGLHDDRNKGNVNTPSKGKDGVWVEPNRNTTDDSYNMMYVGGIILVAVIIGKFYHRA